MVDEQISKKDIEKLLIKRKALFSNAKQLVFGYTGEFTLNEANVNFIQTAKRGDVPNLESIVIQTNGVLFTQSFYQKISEYMKQKIHRIEFSMDAATEETYNQNRLGGEWNKVINNLKYLSIHRNFVLQINFLVQNNNFKEIPMIIDMAKKLGANVNFQQIKNWGTFSKEEFLKRNVFSPEHENHREFLDIVKINIPGRDNIGCEFNEDIIKKL